MPSPPPTANSQAKPADPLPQRPATNLASTSGPSRQEETPIIRQFSGYNPLQRPRGLAGTSPSMIPAAGLGDIGSRPGTNSASSLGGSGSGLRPSYSPFGSRDPAPPADAPKYTIGSTRHDAKPSTPATASPTVSHSHTGGPHHHHHHHHRHPLTGAAPTSATTPATTASTTPATTASTSLPKRDVPFSYGGFRTGFPGQQLTEQELRERERARAREREREMARIEQERKDRAAKTNPATSPRASTGTPANPYPRPSLPPSPTNARTLPSAASASPVISNKASPALPSTALATGSSQRPNLPLPSLSTIGGRSLPSPFDAQGRERPPSAAGQQPGAIHSRTPSGGTGTRPDNATLAAGQVSPGKPVAPQVPGSRALFGTPAFGAGGASRDAKPASNASQASLPTAREPPRPTPAATKPATTATSSTARPPGREFPGNNYPGYGGFMPFSGGFEYSSFGAWAGDRNAQRVGEQNRFDAERKRLAEEDAARLVRVRAATAAREKEAREAREQRERQKEDRMHQARQVELAQARAKESQRMEQANRDQFRRYLDSNTPHPVAQQAQHDALQQVAPRREPRPYEYKTDSRDYQYTPRDKRPRMDAAVDDARRGNANKSKRRKDEDRPKSPVRIRDFSHLTETTRKYPEVKSTAIEAWLKTKSEMNRVVATETYTGSQYRMAHHRSRNTPGGIVKLHIGGGFLGANWKLRGAPGWEEASSTPKKKGQDGPGQGDGQICAGWTNRGIWGTDVYTDDSDLGLVLVHAGWIKWGGHGQSSDLDGDTLVVDVRIVPPLVHYTATERCGVLTRNWGNGHDGQSIVIEAVKRVPADKAILKSKSRKGCKQRMAEYARQREHVFDVDQEPLPRHPDEERVPLAEEIRRVNSCSAIAEPFLVASRDGPTMKYTPLAVSDYLELNDDGQENEGTNNAASNTLWIKDLEFLYGHNKYRLTILESGPSPVLRMSHSPLFLGSDNKVKTTIVFDRVPADKLHWLPDGLAYEAEEATRLCRINGFRWIPRARPDEMEVDE